MSPIKTLRMKWKAAYSDDNENTSFFKSRLAHNIFLLSFVVFCGPCAIFYVLTKNPDTPMSYDDRLALKAITPPKPVKRQRALTLPSEDAFAQKLRGELRGERKKTQDQLESALFRLPAEVRIMVYEAYFGDEIILSLGNKRLKAYRAKYSVAGEDPIRFADVLPLLQSCRRM
jgi:hypothetical protein